jgi:energy-coupling factor transporter ATP-binding protein EcfA2
MYFIIFSLFAIALLSVYGRLFLQVFGEVYESSKNFLLKLIMCLRVWLFHLESKIRSAIKAKPNSKYEALTPSAQIEENKVYSEALEFALEHEDIKNVALSGPYGSGKSTVMKTFEHLHPEYNYLNISLAGFKNEKTDESLLEVSIIQQMFYHVRQSDLPDSRFKRIKKMSAIGILVKVVTFILWLGILVILLGKWPFSVPMIWKYPALNAKPSEVLFWIFLALTIGIVHSIFRMYNGSKFNKLNISTGQLEMSDSVEKTSILNKNLDEIIYFFDVTDFNVVVFEDLDRFTDTEIFTRLRELNIIINNSKQVGRKIVFIYALREEVFGKGSKTKFFDFVVPIIPVVNSSNSGDVLLARLRLENLISQPLEEMCAKLSFYLSDMRIVKNIFNEFLMYRSKLGTFSLDLQKLLGMIVFKNTEAVDFAKLNKNEGLVYELFGKRKTFLETINNASEDRITELLTEIERVKNWGLTNGQELRSVYVMKLFELTEFGRNGNLYIDGNVMKYPELLSEEGFEKFREQASIMYIPIGGESQRAIQFSAVEDSVDESKTFKMRLDELNFKKDYELEIAQKELDSLRSQIRDNGKLKFSELVNHPLIDLSGEEVNNNDTIMFLVRNGYIDEDYHNFITYFHPGKIARKDKEFLLSISNHRAKGFDFEIERVHNLVAEMHLRDFDQIEVLNFTLLDHLFTSEAKYLQEINAFCKHLRPGIELSKKFREEYLLIGKFPGQFVAKLAELHDDFWGSIISDSLYDLEVKRSYLTLLVNNAPILSLRKQDKNGVLSTFISDQNDFLMLVRKDMGVDKLNTILSGLDIKFKDLESRGSKDYFRAILDNGNFELNTSMIAKSVKSKISDKTRHKGLDTKLKECNYTTILGQGDEKLISHVHNNFEEYSKLVLLSEPSNISESEEAFIDALNRMAKFPDDNVNEFTKKMNVLVNDVSKVSSGLRERLFIYNKVDANWPNIYVFHNENPSSDTLLNFLNRPANYNKLKRMNLRDSLEAIEENQVTLLMTYLSESDAYSYDAYAALLTSFDDNLDGISISNLHESKVKALIEKRKLSYNEANFEMIQGKFRALDINLAEHDPEKFLSDVGNYTLDSSEFIRMFKSEKFDFSQKEAFLQHVLADDIRASDELANIIMENFKDVHQDFSFELLQSLAGSDNDKESKAQFLLRYFSEYDNSGIRELLKLIGGDYAILASEDEKSVEINHSSFNEQLLILLKDEGVVTGFEVNGGKIHVAIYT